MFGKYTFAPAFTAIFAVFSDLGYNTLLIREVARDKTQASKYLSNVLGMSVLQSLMIFASIVITINLMGYPADTKNVVCLFDIYGIIVPFLLFSRYHFAFLKRPSTKQASRYWQI